MSSSNGHAPDGHHTADLTYFDPEAPQPDDIDWLAALDAEFGLPAITNADRFIDWSEFWQRDRTEADWLLEDILARGRGHALFATHKSGKSLFMLWVVLQLIRAGVVVIYCDYEMTEDDLWERLVDMGVGPDDDLALLRYWLLPSMAGLDTAKGATELLSVVDEVEAEHPDRHIAVILDTTSRAVEGPENDADTFQAFYSNTGIALKRRGVTYARLDHAGKKAEAGQRGSSAKGDDVDLVWELSRTQEGIALKRHATRIRWAPEKVHFRITEEPLTYVQVRSAWPDGTAALALTLDQLNVPVDCTVRHAAAALKTAERGQRTELVSAAVKYRKAGNTPGNSVGEQPGNATGNDYQKPQDPGPETPSETQGNIFDPDRETGSPPKGEPFPGQGGEAA